MSETYEDDKGRVMVRQIAGGHGGGVTSSIMREATVAEVTAWLRAKVVAAKAYLDAMTDRHDAHVAAVRAAELAANPPPPAPAAEQLAIEESHEEHAQ